MQAPTKRPRESLRKFMASRSSCEASTVKVEAEGGGGTTLTRGAERYNREPNERSPFSGSREAVRRKRLRIVYRHNPLKASKTISWTLLR